MLLIDSASDARVDALTDFIGNLIYSLGGGEFLVKS